MSKRGRRFGPRLTVSLTKADYDQLHALAEKRDVSVSWVMRRAVEEYLRVHPQEKRAAKAMHQ